MSLREVFQPRMLLKANRFTHPYDLPFIWFNLHLAPPTTWTLLWQFTAMMMEMARKVTEDQLKNYFPDGLPALPAPKAKPKRPRAPDLDLTLGEVCYCVCSLIYCHYARCSGAAAGRAVH